MIHDKKWIVAVLASLAMMMNAAPVDMASAVDKASRFLDSKPSGIKFSGSPALRLIHAEPSTFDARLADYYVFEADDSDDGAFVIVAGDDRVAGVLAHGQCRLNMTNLPCGMQWWLNSQKEQMEWLHAHPGFVLEQRVSSRAKVKPLLVSTWSQTEPYYNQCPTYRGHLCVTGCVATAMAQVMYYWKFPAVLSDLPGYTTASLGLTLPDLPPAEADWDNMLEGYSLNYTPAQGDAVALLMRYCGQSVKMDYSPSASGSFSSLQLTGLRLMGYNLGARCLKRDEYNDEEWESLILEDLYAGRPVLYTGGSEESGHAFVLDGYDGYRYHINWGWEGVADGYFYLDYFLDFNIGQQMLHDVYPNVYGVSALPYDFEQDGLCYKVHGNEATVMNREYNYNSYSGNVVIPATVTHDGVTLPVTAIGNNAFNRCTGLKSVVIPQGVKTIGNYAFYGCTSLQSLSLPSSVTSLGYAALSGCTSLRVVVLSNLSKLDYYVMAGCTKLMLKSLPGSVRVIGNGAFMRCSSLTSMNTGAGVTTVGKDAFAGCTSLRDVVLGDAVTTVSEGAFSNCRYLSSVKFGLSVELIESNAFESCDELTSLTLLPEMPPYLVDESCFSEKAYSQATLYVPQISVEDYMFCERWDLFGNVVGIDMEVNRADVNHDGEVNIADVNAVIEAIMNGNLTGDVNDDAEVNIADVNAVIAMILSGGF
ncbi:MAG: C10 family peptidase [Muribaculaceae bacterium]|nr:C10 family peptidase [Muribaculaceae bacterium]